MNNLSLLLWLSDLVKNLSVLNTIFCTLGTLCMVFLLGCVIITTMENHEDGIFLKKVLRWAIPLYIFMITIAVVTPSKQTVLLIAASEATEQVATSTEGKQIVGKVIQALNEQLDKLSEE